MNKKTIIAAVLVSLIALAPLALPLTAKASTIDPNSDEDHDGLTYRQETQLYHSNPNKWDTDGDGWGDGQEVWNGYSPLAGNGARMKNFDSDKDGLTDEQETTVYHSNPSKADTDNDGYTDGLEVKNGYSPIVANAVRMNNTDTDSDGLNDAQEVAVGTNLLSADTDSDGYNDHCEVYSGHNPLSRLTVKTNKYQKLALAR